MSVYILQAAEARVAVVFFRIRSKLWSVCRWDLAADALDQGALFEGTLYPRRSALSPDGELLCYFALKFGDGFLGQAGQQVFTAVSKVPWLTALAAWPEMGTHGRGHHFVRGRGDIGDPQLGDARPLFARYGLARTEVVQYAAERRSGWVEDETCPPRAADDVWDERRSVILTKARPRGEGRLMLVDQGMRFERRIEGRRPRYVLERERLRTELPGVVWADWDAAGRLLVATDERTLSIRDPEALDAPPVRRHELARLDGGPRRAPDWARRW